MARTVLSPARRHDFEDANIGQIIIFCEGQTEKHYFGYFAAIIEKSSKFTDIVVEIEDAKGNARTVLNYAEGFIGAERNSRIYRDYGKYLAFDCDAPPDIQEVILDAREKGRGYNILVSNRFFETWLLMHFEEVDREIGKREVYRRLKEHLHKKRYEKARKGTIREIIQNGSVERAIDNAKRLQSRYASEGMSIYGSIDKMNPYTSIHTLVEQFMVAIS